MFREGRWWLSAGVFCALCLSAGSTRAATIFFEDFNGYSSDDPGIPEISEGADEFWYGGRFEAFDAGTIDQDLAIQAFGGTENPTPVGRFEDEAGLLLRIPAGFLNVALDFDWRTFSATGSDRLVVGYHVGDDLGFDQGAQRFRDFFTDDFGGSQAAAEAWWATAWTELVRGKNDSFQHVTASLPADQVIWVAFWMDNGEGDYGKIDNVHVQADPVPEPAIAALLASGLGALAAIRRMGGRS